MKIKHDAKWFFVEQDPNDRIKSTTRRHALEGDNQSTVARVVREAIQNSVDATLSNRKTEVLFRNQTVSSEAAEEFARLLDLNGNESPLQRLSRLGLKAGNALERLRKLDPNSIEVFIIEDYNTCGLGYDSKDGKDRFDELCLSFGQNRTEVDGERGGSYGFGKEVYEEASDCNLFIVYSVFEPSRKGQEIGSHARLFACATFNGHEWKGGSYKGRALFGVHKKNDRDQIECRPLVDQQAHAVAERLGFEVRARDDYGTSIMILGAKMEMDEVRDALERHWWPRILSNQLSVELWHEDEAQKPPEPCANTDLKPYIDCYEMLQHDIKPKDTLQERKHILQPVNGSQLGSLALKGIEIDPEADDDDEDELRNKIACIRNGPKMVVQYFDPGGRGDGNFTGVFVSHQDAEKALHLSEPPSHDSWNPESRRIQDAYLNKPDKRDQAKKVVESIIKRVKSHAQQFRKDLAPVTLPNPVPGTKKLARILADLMSVKGLGPITPPPPPSDSDPFVLRILESRTNHGFRQKSRVNAAVEVKLRDDAPMEVATVVVSLVPSVVVDDNKRRERSGRLDLSSVKVDGEKAQVQDGFDVQTTISKDYYTNIDAVSELFDRDLYASLDVSVRLHQSDNELGLMLDADHSEDTGAEASHA